MRRDEVIVVGAGIAGGVMARRLAEDRGLKIRMIERRDRPAGNARDHLDEHGIRVQDYGPHIFHTSDERVWQWITRFCEPVHFRPTTAAVVDGITTPSPFNFRTVDQFYDPETAERLKAKMLATWPGQPSVPVPEALRAEDEEIRGFAEFLFEKDFRPYTAKQWNLSPEKIDPSVLGRVPILLSYADRYTDKYQFVPRDGFSAFYARMIDHPGITLETGTDALPHLTLEEESGRVLWDGEERTVIFTGALDALCGFRFGVLPYRTMRFETESLQRESFQEAAVVAYPQAEGYTRITEYTKLPPQEGHGWTAIVREYPGSYDPWQGNEPYYPVLTEESRETAGRYMEWTKRFRGLTLCGRLAEFRYLEMDQVIADALEKTDVWRAD